jgi:hypothetical protein
MSAQPSVELPTEVGGQAYWSQNKWQWTVQVGDPSGEGERSIVTGATDKERFGIGKRNGQVMWLGEKILNLFTLDHSLEVIERVNAVIDEELAKRQ